MTSWEQYFFGQHPESELRNWALRLRFFRYFRAFGGQANDGDSLDLAVAYSGTEELLEILARLGYAPLVHDRLPPQPQIGVGYPSEEFQRFPRIISNTQWIEQPGHCKIFGVRVFLWCGGGLAKVSVGGEDYEVHEQDVRAAEKLEANLAALPLRWVDPPSDTRNYLCPKYYPDFFP